MKSLDQLGIKLDQLNSNCSYCTHLLQSFLLPHCSRVPMEELEELEEGEIAEEPAVCRAPRFPSDLRSRSRSAARARRD